MLIIVPKLYPLSSFPFLSSLFPPSRPFPTSFRQIHPDRPVVPFLPLTQRGPLHTPFSSSFGAASHLRPQVELWQPALDFYAIILLLPRLLHLFLVVTLTPTLFCFLLSSWLWMTGEIAFDGLGGNGAVSKNVSLGAAMWGGIEIERFTSTAAHFVSEDVIYCCCAPPDLSFPSSPSFKSIFCRVTTEY